jgi:hypothetical protein
MHRNRPVVFGNLNDEHRIYIGSDEDHEDFQDVDNTATISVFPGVSERLVFGFVYKDRAFLVKYPKGLYYIDDSAGANPASWAVREASSGIGGASQFAGLEALDDYLLLNATGSITSLGATQAFGDVKSGDLLTILKVEDFFRRKLNPTGLAERRALYYGEKKTAMFAFRGRGSSKNSAIISIDYSGQKPRVVYSDKDQANCLELRKDYRGVQRPIYGSEDGYVYEMDQKMRNVADTAYRSEFHTADYDFSQLGADIAEKDKAFRALEIIYEPTGRSYVYVEVFIDGVYRETIPFLTSYGRALGAADELAFKLDHTRLTGRTPRKRGAKLHGRGSRIGFKVYQEDLNKNFRLLALKIHFKILGQSEKADDK